MNRITAIVSPTGGSGKTTLAINLVSALQEEGNSVILVDGNMMASDLVMHLNYNNSGPTLHDVIIGKEKIFDSIHVHKSGLCFIPSSISVDDVFINAQSNPKKLRRELKKLNAWVILDCPSGISDEIFTLVDIADDILIVSTADERSIANTVKFIDLLNKMGKTVRGVVINKRFFHKFELSISDMKLLEDIHVIGEIPFDKKMLESSYNGIPVLKLHPRTKSSLEIRNIARILSKEI